MLSPSHTARSCSVWRRMSTTSGLVPTNFISLAAHHQFGCAVSEREVLTAGDEKEAVGRFHRDIVKHGRLGHTRHEPLSRLQRWESPGSCVVWRMMSQATASLRTRLTRSHEHTGHRAAIGTAKTLHLGTASDQAVGRTRGCHWSDSVLNNRPCRIHYRPGHCRRRRSVSDRLA
jgi:hypothetical protein